jgi:hypothetical protein
MDVKQCLPSCCGMVVNICHVQRKYHQNSTYCTTIDTKSLDGLNQSNIATLLLPRSINIISCSDEVKVFCLVKSVSHF